MMSDEILHGAAVGVLRGLRFEGDDVHVYVESRLAGWYGICQVSAPWVLEVLRIFGRTLAEVRGQVLQISADTPMAVGITGRFLSQEGPDVVARGMQAPVEKAADLFMANIVVLDSPRLVWVEDR